MKPKKMIFLDRDGVINRNPVYLDYIKKPSEFYFLPGACRAVKMLTDCGFDIVVVSNQGGVAKGLFSKEDLKKIDKKMMRGILASGGRIRKSYYCTHHSAANCKCKKPRTGLVKKAIGKRRLNRKNSYFIGDTERDIATGKKTGIKTIAVLSGYNSKKDIKAWKQKPDFIARDLLAAVEKVVVRHCERTK